MCSQNTSWTSFTGTILPITLHSHWNAFLCLWCVAYHIIAWNVYTVSVFWLSCVFLCTCKNIECFMDDCVSLAYSKGGPWRGRQPESPRYNIWPEAVCSITVVHTPLHLHIFRHLVYIFNTVVCIPTCVQERLLSGLQISAHMFIGNCNCNLPVKKVLLHEFHLTSPIGIT